MPRCFRNIQNRARTYLRCGHGAEYQNVHHGDHSPIIAADPTRCGHKLLSNVAQTCSAQRGERVVCCWRQGRRSLPSRTARAAAARGTQHNIVSGWSSTLHDMENDKPLTTSYGVTALPSLDTLYEQLGEHLRRCWHPDLPVGRWLADRWDLFMALRETYEQNWAQIAERLHALGVRRNRRRELSAAWLRRYSYSAVLYAADAHVRAQLRDWGLTGSEGPGTTETPADAAQPDWFPVGLLLGDSGRSAPIAQGRANRRGSYWDPRG